MFFMGQEWRATAPFNYFTDHSDPSVIEGVLEGYKKEFAHFVEQGLLRSPQDPQVFLDCQLDYPPLETLAQTPLWQYLRELLKLRRHIPALHNCRKDLTHVQCHEEKAVITAHRRDLAGSEVLLITHLSAFSATHEIPFNPGQWHLITCSLTDEGKPNRAPFPNQITATESRHRTPIDFPGWTAALYGR